MFPDFTFRVPACLDTYRERLLDLFGARERRGIDAYVRFVRDVGTIGDAVMRHGPAHAKTALTAVRHGLGSFRYLNATMADFFAANGYATGLFGKWHLGDNYPFRPQDRGFQESIWFPSSHINSVPDLWDND